MTDHGVIISIANKVTARQSRSEDKDLQSSNFGNLFAVNLARRYRITA
jgi:hypothetical protein